MKNLARKLRSIAMAQRQIQAWSEALVQATRTAYPEGARVQVVLGGATVVGQVVRSGGSPWFRPSDVVIVNERTGKKRRFSAAHPDIYKPVVLS